MRTKFSKKSVDSIRKRETLRSLVLIEEKFSRKYSSSKTLFPEAKTKGYFSENFLQSIKRRSIFFLLKDSAMKVIAVNLIIGVCLLGISKIGGTVAFFNDIEMLQENTFAAGTLDFSISSPTEGFVMQNNHDESEDNDDLNNDNINHDGKQDEDEDDYDDNKEHNNDEDQGGNNDDKKMEQNNHEIDNHEKNGNGNTEFLAREIDIEKEGDMSFQYALSTKNISGNMELCNTLTLQAKLADEIIYSGNIKDFNLEDTSIVIGETGKDIWSFTIVLERNKTQGDEHSSEIKSCQFDFSFRAWQIDLGPEYGFGTEKEIQNVVKLNSENESGDDEDDNKRESPDSVDNDDNEETETITDTIKTDADENKDDGSELDAPINDAGENKNNEKDKKINEEEDGNKSSEIKIDANHEKEINNLENNSSEETNNSKDKS